MMLRAADLPFHFNTASLPQDEQRDLLHRLRVDVYQR
jgi:hypothetical protein